MLINALMINRRTHLRVNTSEFIMKVFILLTFLVVIYASKGLRRATPSACLSEKKIGPCKGNFPRFFFNKEKGKCESFTYGGCEGNSNNFMSREDCEAVCKEADKRECLKMPEKGTCLGVFPMYFYDHSSRSCKLFNYTGCGGNENRFSTLGECQDLCGDFINNTECEQKPDKGVCRRKDQMYYYDKNTRSCRSFLYTGCLGNNNRFVTREDCEDICGKSPRRPNECLLNKDPGSDKLFLNYDVRWYFNSETGKCEDFYFKPVGGNANNFKTEGECKAICE